MKTGIVSSTVLVAALAAPCLVAPFLPPELTWGFHFLRFLSPAFVIGYILLVALLAASGPTGLPERAVGGLARACERNPARFLGVALAVFLAAGFIFRIEVPLLGDSWYLVKNFAGSIRGTEELLPRDEPLATYYLSGVLALFNVKTFAGFMTAFFAGGMALGAGYVVILFFIVRLLFADHCARVTAFVMGGSLPSVILFFGYVETYAVVLFALSLYTLAGLLHLRGRVPFAVVAVAFLLQALTHYLTVLTLPSLLYLAWLGVRRGEGRDVLLGGALSAFLFLLVLAAVGFNVTNYFSQVPHRHYLPLTEPTDPMERYSSPYTLFSLYHAVDLANLAILLLPAALALIVAGGRKRFSVASFRNLPDAARFLLASVIPVACFMLVAKFDLGTARDWDVTAPYSFLFVLFGLVWYHSPADGPRGPAVPALIAGAALLNALLWFSVTSSSAASVERFRSLLDPRLTGQAGMYSANLYLSRYYHQAGMGGGPSAGLWERYITLYPWDQRGFRNTLNNLRAEGAGAEAAKLREWSVRFASDPAIMRSLAGLAFDAGNAALDDGRDAAAETLFTATLDIDPAHAASWNNLGTILARRGDYAGAAGMFDRAVRCDSNFADAWFNLGRARYAAGEGARGREAIERSARLGNKTAQELLGGGRGQ